MFLGFKKGKKINFGTDYRSIYEHFNNCVIKKGSVIHHKDHNHQNNSPDNLVLMSANQHNAHHRKHRKTRRGLSIGVDIVEQGKQILVSKVNIHSSANCDIKNEYLPQV